MIDFYSWSMLNGRKVFIGLEEMRLAYKLFPINIAKNEQFAGREAVQRGYDVPTADAAIPMP